LTAKSQRTPSGSTKSDLFIVLSKIEQSKPLYFRHSTVRQIVLEKGISLTAGVFSQYLAEAVDKGLIFDGGRGWYSSLKSRFVLDSKPIKPLVGVLAKAFPLLDFSCWSTEQVNPFSQHLMSGFLSFVYVDSDAIGPVSESLRDRGYLVFADPGKAEVADSFRLEKKAVVIRKAISKQPRGSGHASPIEKILVDLVWESRKLPGIDESEARLICDGATAAGRVSMSELLGYAKRRTLDFSWLGTIN